VGVGYFTPILAIIGGPAALPLYLPASTRRQRRQGGHCRQIQAPLARISHILRQIAEGRSGGIEAILDISKAKLIKPFKLSVAVIGSLFGKIGFKLHQPNVFKDVRLFFFDFNLAKTAIIGLRTAIRGLMEQAEFIKTVLPSLGSLVAVLLTGAIGVATYSWQENVKRQTELVERRQKLYEDLNSALFGLILAENLDDRRKILAEIEKGWLFASDDVLAAIFAHMETFDRHWLATDGKVHTSIQTDAATRGEIERSLAAIFIAMRRDLRHTDISAESARTYMKFYQCGMLDRSSGSNPDRSP
jgi:hypothetical protein